MIDEIDWSENGKQVGALTVDAASAAEQTPGRAYERTPVLFVKNGDGPTLYLNAGTHGDEYEGQIALRRLWARLTPEDIAGSVIIVPTLNRSAAEADQRESVTDGRDLNRSFPGKPTGAHTERLAAAVAEHLVTRADIVVDLHAGGTIVNLIPTVMMHFPHRYVSAEQYERCLAAAEAFGVQHILHLEEQDHSGLLDTVVEQQGKPFLCVELGGGGTASAETVNVAERGAWAMLAHFGLLAGRPPAFPPAPQARNVDVIPETFTFSDWDGLFEPAAPLGAEIAEGEAMGRIYSLDDPTAPPTTITAAGAGVLVVQRARTRTRVGDFLGALARPRSKKEV